MNQTNKLNIMLVALVLGTVALILGANFGGAILNELGHNNTPNISQKIEDCEKRAEALGGACYYKPVYDKTGTMVDVNTSVDVDG